MLQAGHSLDGHLWCRNLGYEGSERRRTNIFEMKCLSLMVGVTRKDRFRNDEIRRRAGTEETLAEKVDRRVL